MYKRQADEYVAELLLTTGGTGFSPRDCMPEATMDIAERMVPGIPEAMRAYSMTITPRAMLSRAAACIRKNTLIINLPGSPKAVKESLGLSLIHIWKWESPALPASRSENNRLKCDSRCSRRA